MTHKYKLRCRLSVNDYNRFLFFKLALTTCHESCHNVSNFKSHQTIFYVYICIIYKIDKNFDELVLQGGHTHFRVSMVTGRQEATNQGSKDMYK